MNMKSRKTNNITVPSLYGRNSDASHSIMRRIILTVFTSALAFFSLATFSSPSLSAACGGVRVEYASETTSITGRWMNDSCNEAIVEVHNQTFSWGKIDIQPSSGATWRVAEYDDTWSHAQLAPPRTLFGTKPLKYKLYFSASDQIVKFDINVRDIRAMSLSLVTTICNFAPHVGVQFDCYLTWMASIFSHKSIISLQ